MAIVTRSPHRTPSPPPRHGARPPVRIRHPGYNEPNNVLLTLPSTDFDGRLHGVQFGLVHTAAAIIANNRFDGWISRSRSRPGSQRLETHGWQAHELLEGGDYYFYVPTTAEAPIWEAGGNERANDDGTDTSVQLARSSDNGLGTAVRAETSTPYPIVPNFRSWSFPAVIPPSFIAAVEEDSPNEFGLMPVPLVRMRDRGCLLTASPDAVEFAHLIPSSESDWFHRNNMRRYVLSECYSRSVLDSEHNAITLRRDIHQLWDQLSFTIFPKPFSSSSSSPPSSDVEWGFTLHVTAPSSASFAKSWHNRRLRRVRGVRPEYFFARFARDIFPLVSNFLTTRVTRTLTVWHEGEQKPSTGDYTAEQCRRLSKNQGPGRSSSSSSPRKRRGNEGTPADCGGDDDESSSADGADSGIGELRERKKKGFDDDGHADESSDEDDDDDYDSETERLIESGYSAEEIRIERECYERVKALHPEEDEPGWEPPRGRKRQRVGSRRY